MDSIILAAALISFVALMGSWLVLPASNENTTVVAHGAPVRV